MSFVCQPYVLVCHSYVIRMSLVCTRMTPVCHSYVLVCHPSVTRMWFYHEPKKKSGIKDLMIKEHWFNVSIKARFRIGD